MAALKPVQSSVCNVPKVWKEICESVTKSPSEEAKKRAISLSKKFSKVVKN